MKTDTTKHKQPYYRTCLKQSFADRCSRNPRYSIRAFARTLGVDHAAISRFLSGERIPSYTVALKLLKCLNLNPAEEQRFLSSIAGTRKETLQRVSPAFRNMSIVQDTLEFSVEQFKVISDWYHYAILELTQTDQFKSDPKWMARELGISLAETEVAIDRLLQVGLLERKPDGQLTKSVGHMTTADKNMTNSALKRHQEQILKKAIESLETDPLETRSMTSMTMAIDPQKLSVAKQMIEDFTQSLCRYLEAEGRTQVYELGICLYPIQKSETK